MPSGKSFGDRRDSAAGSVLEPAASICDSFATTHRLDNDRFLLVVISVACASFRTLRTGCQSYDKLSVAGNTKDMAPTTIAASIRSIALCS